MFDQFDKLTASKLTASRLTAASSGQGACMASIRPQLGGGFFFAPLGPRLVCGGVTVRGHRCAQTWASSCNPSGRRVIHWSEIRDQRTEVRDQRSEVGI